MRLLKDKVCFEIILVKQVNSMVGKNDSAGCLPCLEGFYLESSFLKRFEIYT